MHPNRLLADLRRLFDRCFLFSVFVGLLTASAGLAQTRTLNPSSLSFDLPAGPAEETLKEFAQVATSSMTANSATLAGVQTNAVQGEYTPEQALSLMLAETGLTATWDEQKRAFSVRREGNTAAGVAANTPAPANTAEGVQKLADFMVTATKAQPYQDGNMDIPRTSDDVQPYTIINQEAIQESNAYDLSAFLKDEVTQNTVAQLGTQLTPTNSVTPAFLTNVNLRGLGNLQTLILVDGNRLSLVNNPSSGGISESQADIEGIPLGAVDHVEILPSSASAIYGASAAGGVINIVLKKNYAGGEIDASYQNPFAGDGPLYTMAANFGFPIGKKIHVSLIASYNGGKPLVMQDRTFLMDNYDRAMRNDPALFYSNTVPFLGGTTPNIVLDPAVVNGYTNPQTKTLTLTNGTSLNSLITYIPPGTSPSTSTATLDSGLLANAGSYNFNWAPTIGSTGVGTGLNDPIEQSKREESFRGTINYDLTPAVKLFAEFSNSSDRTPTKILLNTPSTIAVPGNAPDNPFQENVFITIPLSVSNSNYQIYTDESRSLTVGLSANLPADWHLAADFSTDTNILSLYRYALSPDSLVGAGGGGNGIADLLYNGTINPFVDTIQYLQNLLSTYTATTAEFPTDVLNDFNLRASGPVLSLPAGKTQLTLGLEGRTDSLDAVTIYNTAPPAVIANNEIRYSPGSRQATQAGYAEAEIPIVSEQNHISFVDSLELQGAVRTENFENLSNSGTVTALPSNHPPTVTSTVFPNPTRNKFASTTSTFGFKYKPLKTVTLRASYSAAFIPPTDVQLATNPNPVIATSAAFLDPVTGTTYTTERNSGTNGNPNLSPQTSKDWDAGVIWEPKGKLLEGLRVNLEFFKIVEKNLIIAPPAVQVLVDAPSEAANITRSSPTGPITFINFQYYNVSQEYTDGWDLSLDFRKQTSLGAFNLHAGATIIEHLKEPPAVGSPLVEYVGFVDSGGADKLKANASLSWYIGRHWTIGWRTIFYDGYKQNGAPSDPEYLGAASYTPITTNTLPQGANTIPSQMYHNIFASYTFGASPGLHHILEGVTIQVGINDLFNTAPPFDAYSGNSPYYYSPFGDPALRSYVLKLRKSF